MTKYVADFFPTLLETSLSNLTSLKKLPENDYLTGEKGTCSVVGAHTDFAFKLKGCCIKGFLHKT
jgi:hypothetical protein